MSELGFPIAVSGGDDPAIAPIDTVGGKSILAANAQGQTKRVMVDDTGAVIVTGTLSPSGTQDVDIVASITLPVDVDNFPSNQDVTVTNTPSVTISGTPTVDVGNFPSVQNVDIVNTPSVTLSGTPAVDVGNFPATQAVIQSTTPWTISGAVTESNVDKSFGTWAYYAGTSGTVTVTAGQRVIGISAHSTSGGTMTINGGATITIPANVSFNLSPLGNVVAPTIVFTSTDTYFIEVVS